MLQASVLSNILAREPAFQPPKKLLYQALQALLNGTSLEHFSTLVRSIHCAQPPFRVTKLLMPTPHHKGASPHRTHQGGEA